MHLMNCPVCGKRIPFNSPQCPECGFELTEYIESESQNRPRHIKRVLSIIALIMIGLILVDVGISMWTNTGHSIDLPLAGTNTASVKKAAGVYSGDDGDVLVINDSGMAYYFCSSIEFTELECPCKYKKDILSIEFAKMHCLAYASIQNDDFSEILLRSDSQNWNPELFTRINVSPNDYLKRSVETNDIAVSVEHDGTMAFTLDGLSFKVPKQFRDVEGDFDSDINTVAFVEVDVDSDYTSSLLFYKGDYPADINFQNHFLSGITLGDSKSIEIAGRNAVTCPISGSLNKGFQGLAGLNQSGTLTVILNPQTNSVVYILMLQTEDRAIDNSNVFERILDSCETE